MWPTNWSFSLPSWAVSNSLQKRLVKYLLRRTVGQFLKTELDDENLDVQLSGGQLRLKNVQLSEEALNDAISGLPVVVSSGVIGVISVSVPWTQLWTGHCELQIEDLVVKTQLLDEEADEPDASMGSNEGDGADRRWAPKSRLAESIAMSEGGASILTSSVFIADDFLRAETLGYGTKDELFINKDVERLVANAHEERAQYYRSRTQQREGNSKNSGLGSSHRPGGQKGKKSLSGAEDSDEFEDAMDALPLPPGSPGGSMRGLQVVSEMVDRIISAVNIRVRNVSVECLVPTKCTSTGASSSSVLKLSLASIDFVDDRNNTERKSGSSTESASPRRQGGSGDVSDEAAAGSDSDHPAGIEYKVVEYRTLYKLLEIRGLRVSLEAGDGGDAAAAPIISTFGNPIATHLRIHRRMPFSELAPVQPKGVGNDGVRRNSAENAESVYMGPMPGEFREIKATLPAISADNTVFDRPVGSYPSGARARNILGEEATTSGWDVSVDIGDLACVLTKSQLATLAAIVDSAAPLLRLRSERQEMKDRYQETFGDKIPDQTADLIPQLAKWISAKCKHIYAAVLPEPHSELLNGWHDGSLAVLRLKLETVKHLALYVKNVGAKWESAPVLGTKSAPGGLAVHTDTEFWAAMARENTAGGNGGMGGSSIQDKNECVTTVSAYLQNISLYDNDPECYPVVRQLITVDRTLDVPQASHLQNPRQHEQHPSRAERNSKKYDIWLCVSESDLVLTINIAPIIVALNKELADRLSIYQQLLASIAPSRSPERTQGANIQAADRFATSSAFGRENVADSIENLMNNLKLKSEHKMPSNLAVCSPLIRTWITLPGTLGSGGSKGNLAGSQIRSRGGKDSGASSAPGHFCIDAIDAVITNVVNGTAVSSQTQDEMPDGHMRHPHIQELLESRKSVAGSGIRVECEALHAYVQLMEGSSEIDHVASVHGPRRDLERYHEPVSIPRPHIEITTVTKSGHQTPDRESAEYFGRRPPAFDAFSAVDDNIRVRMAPESELSTSLKFERLAVALSRLVVSCHLPETEITLNKAVYQRLNAVINDFLLWQSIQDEIRSGASNMDGSIDIEAVSEDSADLGVSVFVDMPQMVASINTSDSYSSRTRSHDQQQTHSGEESHRVRLSNTQMFMSNAIIEKGRMYVSVESNQVRLSSFVGESEIGAVVSHSFASPETPIITPQLSLYMLTSPTITEESEIVLKTTWTTVDYQNDSTCLRDLEAFFSSQGTSGLVQPPPKPMRLSLNVQNSSLTWTPACDPSICSAALSLDSLAVIVGINSPIPERDREELHYYVEGLSVFGKSTDSLATASVDVSSDAWVSTGRFWKDHGYSVLVHMDMVDVASRTKEGEDGPLVDLRLYSEALVLDACADSVGTLPLILQSLISDLTGTSAKPDSRSGKSKNTRVTSPQILGQVSDNIFGDIEENTFAMAPLPPTAAAFAYSDQRHARIPNSLSPRASAGRYHDSFTHDFENGLDDIGALAMNEYFAPHTPPDVADDYEVVGGGKALSPTSTMHPVYSRSSHPQQQQQHQNRNKQTNVGHGPTATSPQSRRAPNSSSSTRHAVDIQVSKGKGKGVGNRAVVGSGGSAHLGAHSSSYSFGDDGEDDFDLGDYVDMTSDGELIFETEDDMYQPGFGASPKGRAPPQLQSRFAGQQFDTGNSVLLEPEYPSIDPRASSKTNTRVVLPHTRVIDSDHDIVSGHSYGGGHSIPVKITSMLDRVDSQDGSEDSVGEGGRLPGVDNSFEIIEDYFKVPAPGDVTTDDEDLSVANDHDRILCLTIDVARVEINLYSGQDWYVSAEQPVAAVPFDPGYQASYLDTLSDAASVTYAGDAGYGRVSASMPESRGPIDHYINSLNDSRQPRKQVRQQPGRPARRSAKPKIELKATHVHAEYKQFSEASATAYDLGLNVGMLEILDQLETSEWSKFLTRRRDVGTGLPSTLHSLANTRNRELLTKGTSDSDRVTSAQMRRQRSSRWPDSNAGPMICIQVESVRPYPTLAAEELRVDFEISPLRCYIHQDALDFLIRFFESAEQKSSIVAEIKRAQTQQQGGSFTAEQELVRGDGRSRRQAGVFGQRKASTVDQPYFQIVRFAPINIIFDYKPRRIRVASGAGTGSSAAATVQGQAGATTAATPTGIAGGSPSLGATGGNTGGLSNANAAAAASSSSSRKPVELLNFFPLEDAEMTLNTVKVRGVAGVSKLIRELGNAWLPHLARTQIPGVVSGMTPLRSLVNIGTGVADLVILPLEQYRKDGRLVQGIKRGAQSFARTTALEAIQLGAKVAVNAQTFLEQAGDILNVDVSNSGESGSKPHSHEGRLEGMLSPRGGTDQFYSQQSPHIMLDLADWPDYMSADGQGSVAGTSIDNAQGSSSSGGVGGSARRGSFNKSKYARQPENLSEGMRQAYMSLRSNVGDAVQTILAIPVVMQEGVGDGDSASGDAAGGAGGGPGRSPVHGSVRAVVRAVPVAVLKPMIGATEAVSKTLLGLRNTIEPARRGQLEDKYKSRQLGAKKSYPS
ncbi:autophagy- protein 2 [Coemansia sp. Benny D115]|nr:autophagy- protein 2 [Coemansia sp. Benny D115]